MQNKKMNAFPLSKLFPSFVTIIGIVAGLSAIRFALFEKWEMAVIAILVAAILDGMDGRLARMLNASSGFGMQLDSLSDFVNFGVAPALIIYQWQAIEVKGVGWAFALFFVICSAIRLARFNVTASKDEEDGHFFAGVAAPAGGLLALLPMIVTFLLAEKFEEAPFAIPAYITIANMGIIALLMASRIPTISIKKVTIKSEYGSIFMALVSLFIISLIIETWLTLTIVGIGYLALIPLTAIYSKFRRS